MFFSIFVKRTLMRSSTFYLSILFIITILQSCGNNTAKDAEARTEFFVRGNCGMCKERIETAVMHVDGVKAADWNVDSKLLNVTYDSSKTTVKSLNKAVAEVGHETKLEISPKDTHDKLPMCCQKTSM